MDRNEIVFWQGIRTKCTNVRNDILANIDAVRRAALSGEPNEIELQGPFESIYQQVENMQSIIEIWSPFGQYYHQFAHGVVPIVKTELICRIFHSTEPLTPELLWPIVCSLEALTEEYNECCYMIFAPLQLPSPWEWSAYPIIMTIPGFYIFTMIVIIFLSVLLLRMRKRRVCQILEKLQH